MQISKPDRVHADGISRRAVFSVSVYFAAIGCALAVMLLADRAGFIFAALFLAAGIIFLIGFSDFKIFIYLLILLLPLTQTFIFSSKNSSISGPKLLAVLSFLTLTSVFFAHILRPNSIKIPKLSSAFYAFFAVIAVGAAIGIPSLKSIPTYFLAISVLHSVSVESYLTIWLLSPCLILLICFICSLLSSNSPQAQRCILAVFASALIISYLVIARALSQNTSLSELAAQDARGYLSAIGLHANEIGLMMNMAFALSLFTLYAAPSKPTRALIGIVTGFSISAVLLTFSRAAYLGIFLSFLYFVYVKRTWFSIAVLGIVIAGIAVFMPETMIERSQQGVAARDIASLSTGRWDGIWVPLLPEIVASPLIGNGHGSILWSNAARQQYILPVGHPHSAYLSALMDVGLIGTIVFAAFYLEIWRTFQWLMRRLEPGLLQGYFQGASVCILIIVFQGLTDDSFVPSYTHAYLWISYGLGLGLKARMNIK